MLICEIKDDKVVFSSIVNVALPIVNVPAVICSLKPDSEAVSLVAVLALNKELVELYSEADMQDCIYNSF